MYMFWFWLINNCQRPRGAVSVHCSPWHWSALLHASTQAWTSRKQTCPSLSIPLIDSSCVQCSGSICLSLLSLYADSKCHCFLVACVRAGCSESAAPCSSPGHTRLIKFTLVSAWFALFIQNSQTMNIFCLKSMRPIRPVNEMRPIVYLSLARLLKWFNIWQFYQHWFSRISLQSVAPLKSNTKVYTLFPPLHCCAGAGSTL